MGCHNSPDRELFRSWQAAYYAAINHIDDQLRRVVYRIPGVMEGIDPENTIVVFTADHGDMLEDHGLYAKSQPYEGSARVPLIVRAPRRFGLIAGARIDEQLFHLGNDPEECRNLAADEAHAAELAAWRERMIADLADRPEGFVQDGALVPGVTYRPTIPDVVAPHAQNPGDREDPLVV